MVVQGSDGLCGRAVFVAVLTAVIVIASASLQAQESKPSPVKMSLEELTREIDRLKQERRSLVDSPEAPPAWTESRKLYRELGELKRKRAAEEEALRRNAKDFLTNPEYVQWATRVRAIAAEIKDLELERYERTLTAGRELYEARHKRLAGAFSAAPNARKLGLDVLTFPRMDGSTSAQPLTTIIACRCLGAEYAWTSRMGRSTSVLGTPASGYDEMLHDLGMEMDAELRLAEYLPKARIDIPAQERLGVIINRLLASNASTHQAYVNVIEGQSEMGLLARPPSHSEIELAKAKGVELETVACALDAFVFLVNEQNPIPGLITAQIRDIYSGQTTQWSRVGGADQLINAYQREDDSGSQELMRELVMKELPFAKPDSSRRGVPPEATMSLGKSDFGRRGLMLIAQGMGGPYVALTNDPNGLAYSVWYYEQYMAGSPRTRTIAVDGIEPTYENIRSRKYPYIAELLIVTRKGLDPASPAARLRDWILSPEGQRVVRESGFAPVSGL